jgi:integrase
LDRTLAATKWDKIRGWHIFRHSFISNCACVCIDQRMIDSWVGHQTDAMRRRYTHLFPHVQHAAIAGVFAEPAKVR